MPEFISPPLKAAVPGTEGLHCKGEAGPELGWRQQETQGGRKAPRQRAKASVAYALGYQPALTSAAALRPRLKTLEPRALLPPAPLPTRPIARSANDSLNVPCAASPCREAYHNEPTRQLLSYKAGLICRMRGAGVCVGPSPWVNPAKPPLAPSQSMGSCWG